MNDVGAAQARALGARLRRCPPVEALFTSDLRRAAQTADIVVESLGLETRVDTRLREIHRGELEGKGWEVVKEEYPEFYREWTLRQIDVPYPQGESGAEVWERASAAIGEIVKAHSEAVAIVTHGGTIMALLSGYLGLALFKRFGFRIDQCSISTVESDDEASEFKVTRVNDTAHLESLKLSMREQELWGRQRATTWS